MKNKQPTKTYVPLSDKAYDGVFYRNKKKILILSIATAIIVVVGFSLLFFLPQVVYTFDAERKIAFFSLKGMSGATYTAANLFAKPFYGFEKAGYYIFYSSLSEASGFPEQTDLLVELAMAAEPVKAPAIVLGLVSKLVMAVFVFLLGYSLAFGVRIFTGKNRFISWYNMCNGLLTAVSVLSIGALFIWLFCCSYSGRVNVNYSYGQGCLLNVLSVALLIIVPTVYAAYLGTIKRSADKVVQTALEETDEEAEEE